MTKSRTIPRCLLAVVLLMALSACSSIRYESTLKPSGDKALHMGDVRFSIVPLGEKQGEVDTLAKRSKDLYPDLFTDEWTGLPVAVKIDSSMHSSMGLSAFLTGFCTLGIIPFPGSEKHTYNVETSLINTRGERMPDGKVAFEFDKAMWMTVLSPLGLLPIPGTSDLSRDYQCLFFSPSESFTKAANKESAYIDDCLVEAVVKTLRMGDQAKMAADYQVRLARLQEITLDGKPCWTFLAPWITSPKQERADVFGVLIYQERPTRNLKPLETVAVARRDGSGVWHPVSAYVRHARALTKISVLVENNLPSKVVLRTIETPPLEDFIDTPDLAGSDRNEILRWSNGVLLDAKNRSLTAVLREENREGLLSRVTRIEQAIMDLNEKSEQAKDRAQSMVEKGEGDPGPDRELAVLCRQRIEVLKPILAALKQALATGNS